MRPFSESLIHTAVPAPVHTVCQIKSRGRHRENILGALRWKILKSEKTTLNGHCRQNKICYCSDGSLAKWGLFQFWCDFIFMTWSGLPMIYLIVFFAASTLLVMLCLFFGGRNSMTRCLDQWLLICFFGRHDIDARAIGIVARLENDWIGANDGFCTCLTMPIDHHWPWLNGLRKF